MINIINELINIMVEDFTFYTLAEMKNLLTNDFKLHIYLLNVEFIISFIIYLMLIYLIIFLIMVVPFRFFKYLLPKKVRTRKGK